MAGDDPFAGRDGTIIKPNPRGRPAVRSNPRVAPSSDTPTLIISGAGANPILTAATSLLTVAGQLRRAGHYDNTAELSRSLSGNIKAFEQELTAQQYPPQTISAARYVICGFLDEAILNTPWGAESNWSSNSLLAEFHNELSAGEKMFDLLDQLIKDPAQNIELIELIYVCISLGFQGKYRRASQGLYELEQIRLDTHAIISKIRGSAERELSPHWQGVVDERPRLVRYVPWWVVLAVALGVLVLGYFLFLRMLGTASDPVVAEIVQLGRELPPVTDGRTATPMVQSVYLTDLLSEQINSGLIDPGNDRDTVILRGLFASASTNIGQSHDALLQDIAEVLAVQTGSITVSGHTDNVPIRTIRFPSNWELSEQRAQAVFESLVAKGVDANQMLAEARADTEPLCSSKQSAQACNESSADARANNRRVEIQLQSQAYSR